MAQPSLAKMRYVSGSENVKLFAHTFAHQFVQSGLHSLHCRTLHVGSCFGDIERGTYASREFH